MSAGAESCVLNQPGTTLVIGWGNELRGDDAAGRVVAADVERWAGTNVRVLSVHQLLPELAEPVAEAGRILFVDTRVDHPTRGVLVQSVVRDGGASAVGILGHASGPERILQLAFALYGVEPEAWVISVPGTEFGVGRPMGPATKAAVQAATSRIRDLLEQAST